MPNPFRVIQDIRRDELPFVAPMFVYFFLVISTFWALKPLKKGLFVTYYENTGVNLFGAHFSAAQAEQVAKVGNVALAALAVLAFTLLVGKLRRARLAMAITAFFAVMFLIFATLLTHPSDVVVWGFYHLGDLFSTLMVATFFAFLNDSVSPTSAKRLYGVMVLGGVAGGAFGTTALRGLSDTLSESSWMLVCAGVCGVLMVLQALAGRYVSANPPPNDESMPEALTTRPSDALDGARLVMRSRYLLAIVAIVSLYEVVSTIVDFQFTQTVLYYLDGDAIRDHFELVYQILTIGSLLVQLIITSMIMTRVSVRAALFVLPGVILLMSVGFMAMPILWVGSALIIADGGFAHSLNQSAKEVLYTTRTQEEKYKAKAFIDMFGQRAAKAIGVAIGLGVTRIESDFRAVAWLSLAVIAVCLVWFVAANYVGREFAVRENKAAKVDPQNYRSGVVLAVLMASAGTMVFFVVGLFQGRFDSVIMLGL